MSNTNNKMIMRKRGLDFDDYDYDFDEDEQTSCYTDDRPAASQQQQQQQQQQKLKKPRRKDITEIATSLTLLHEQERCDDEESAKSVLEERQFFEAGCKEKTRVMMKYKSDVDTRCAESDFQDLSFVEKSRLNTATGVLTAVAVQGVVSFDSSERKKAVAAAASNNNNNNNSSSKSDKNGGGGGGGAAAASSQRRLWVKARSKAWWDECNSPDYPEEDFKRAFRMSKRTFEVMCDELNSFVAKENTTLRDAIPVKQRVAVCVWRLATGEPLRMVSKRFGLGISTCHKLVLEVCSAIRTVLMPKYLQWPDDESLNETKDEFGSVSGIPNIVGSMYTTHIPIIAPKISVAAYFNRRHTERNQKNSYSITVQGVVNPKGVFTDVCIGWPGSMSDDQVLEKSALFQRANGGLLKGVWIVGSSGFPLLDWVMVPYTQQNLTWTQHAFNEKIGEVQRVSKEAFARLKGRWTCLQKRTEVKLQDLPVVLGACCVLHNICELSNEEIDPKLMIDLVDDEMLPEIPLRSASSSKARDSIAHNLLHHGLAGTSFL